MKADILKFIKQVKEAFAKRKNKMPKTPVHKPYIQQLANDELVLENAASDIEQLDESQKKTFAQKVLSSLIELVVPVFSRWLVRNEAIKEAQVAHISGHQTADSEYQSLRSGFHSLLVEVNKADGETLFVIDPKVEKPAIAIVKQYNLSKQMQVEEQSEQHDKVLSIGNSLSFQNIK